MKKFNFGVAKEKMLVYDRMRPEGKAILPEDEN